MDKTSYVEIFESVIEYTIEDGIQYTTFSRTINHRYIHYVSIFLEEHFSLRVVKFIVTGHFSKEYIFRWFLDNRTFTNIIRSSSGNDLDEDEFFIVRDLIDIIINSHKQQTCVKYGFK